MTAPHSAVLFRANFEIEAPDFWWALHRMDLRIGDPADFILEMSVLDDNEALPHSITKWRTQVVWSQNVKLSPESHQTIVKLREGPSLDEALQRSLLDTPIPGYHNFFTYDWIPTTFFREIKAIHDDLDRTAFMVLNSLFWRIGVHCGPSKLESEYSLLEHSIDGVDFDPLPIRWDLKASSYQEPPPKPIPAGFRQSLSTIQAAPVHHALFKEAWKCLESEDRVSVVMATAAVESATKYLISKLQPDTLWLLENTSSPPVDKMLRELIEKLPVKCNFGGRTRRPPNAVITKIKKLIECRNKIVHGSPYDIPVGIELEGWLVAARDVLWLADFYCGHEWAAAYISPDVKEELLRPGET